MRESGSSMSKQIPWLRVFVEGVVIVGSILLAFGIQAWWDESQERAEEQRVLLSLLTEFSAKAEALDMAAGNHEWVLAAAAELLIHTGPNPEIPPSTDVGDLLEALTGTWTYNDRHGVLDAVTNSGQVNIIRNDSLRAALAAWRGEVSDVEEEEQIGRIDVRDHLSPFLRRMTSPPNSRFPENHRSLFAAREFEGLILRRREITLEILEDVRDLQQVLEITVTMLERELSR